MPTDQAIRLKNGNLRIPIRLDEADGGPGEGFIEVKPGSKEFKEWEPFSIDDPD